jgi:hypothetical protein
MDLAKFNEYVDEIRNDDGCGFIWVKVKNAQNYCVLNGMIRAKYPDLTANCQGCDNIFQILERYLRCSMGDVDPLIYIFWDDGKLETLDLASFVSDGEMHPLGQMVVRLTNPRIVIYFSTDYPRFKDEDFEHKFVNLSEFEFASDIKALKA